MRVCRLCAMLPCLALALALLLPATAGAVGPDRSNPQHQLRNFDARVDHNAEATLEPPAEQVRAIDELRAQVPSLAASFDSATGVTRSLYNQVGYLTDGPLTEAAPLDLALDFVRGNLELFGITEADLNDYEITDSVYSKVSGATHLYLRQTYKGLPVYNGQLQVNVNRDGRLISVNNAFMPSLAASINSDVPGLDAAQAVSRALEHLGQRGRIPTALGKPAGAQQTTLLDPRGISREELRAQLMWLPIRRAEARLVWNFQIHTLDQEHVYDFTVDAVTGQVWTRIDWVASDSYRVYPQPIESPNHTSPLPPADARQLITDPANATASPLAWHDTGSTSYTIHRGNNVHAYEDSNNSGSPPATEPDCGGSLSCDFALDLTQAPSTYRPAAVANLFYWNNIIHDIQYQYGFDEAGGNFQVNNFGNGGVGNDDVRAEAQDGSGTNNANFFTPADGSRPRMQMYVWNTVTPNKDGDLDSGIIIHEFGHGISNRLVGGPSNVGCLGNNQQPGEGLSDWWALAYTAEVGDAGTDKRGIGTYALNQPTSGNGIRTQPYSTDPAINTHTYASVAGKAIPHGVGEVWAQGAWEVYWALVDTYGFDPDLYNATGGAGNQRAMMYINEGLKNTACSPAFTDVRDGIIQAATDLNGGQDVCLIWEAFAAFGLGTDAVSGGSNSTSPTNGFSIPLACQCDPAPIANAGPDQVICLGDSTTVGTPAQPSNSYSWSPGGQTTAQISVSPSVTTTYTVTATTVCGSANDSATVTVDSGSGAGISEDFEGGAGSWTTSGLWHLTSNSGCASPGYSSAVNAMYYGQDSTCNYSTGGTTTGTLTSPVIFGITASSTLSFDYYRVVESFSGTYDKTDVEIVTGSGSTLVWSRSSADASTAAWTSSGSISLAAFAGQSIQVRFRFDSVDSVSNTFTGWFIDDVVVTGTSACSPPTNTAPSVTITSPANGSTFNTGDSVSFSGTASDVEDGDLSAGLSWTSSIDGAIGSGASFSTSSLSAGTHNITASVTDSGSLSGSDNITVTVNTPANNAPSVTITAPADGTTVTEGDSVTFSGTASDVEDGDLSASLGWSSDIDGAIGSGASFSTSALSVGTHTITASVTDSGSLSGADSITLTVDPATSTTEVTFISEGAHDGWVRESNETSNVGGRNNSTGTGSSALRPGDATQDRQYKSIVSFDTSSIPDGATIVSVTLRLTRGNVSGTNPFTTHGSCFVDVQSGGFNGNLALENADFQASATAPQSATLSNAPANLDVSEATLDAAGRAAVNKTGYTQLRVSFALDDNDDGGNDYIGYYSGENSTASRRPQLVVVYQ